MENPANWSRAERVVNDALEEFYRDDQAGLVGYSLPMRITNALRKAGLLKEE